MISPPRKAETIPTPLKIRFYFWIVALFFAGPGTLLWLWLIRRERIISSDSLLIGGWIALAAILFLIALLLKTTPPGAIKLSRRASQRLIITGTLLLHTFTIALVWPALSDDVVRYRFDGKTWLAGRSPYAASPAELEALSPADRRFAFDRIDLAIPYPILHTIYPPTSQALFTVTTALERMLGWTPGPATEWSGEAHPQWREELGSFTFAQRALVWRIFSGLLAVACNIIILQLLTDADQSPWWAVLFCWNPLTLIETSGMAHADIAGVLLILLMLLARHRGKLALAAISLALAIGVKPIVVLVLPFLLRDAALAQRHPTAPVIWADPPPGQKSSAFRLRFSTLQILHDLHQLPNRINLPSFLRTLAAFCITIAILSLPLLYRGGLPGWLLTAQIYSRTWEANGSVHEIFKAVFGHGGVGRAIVRANEISRQFSIIMIVLTTLALWRARASLAAAAHWLLLILLICSPVVYPWYLLWVLSLVPLLRGPQGLTALAWSATIALSYLLLRQESNWMLSMNATLWEYVPVAVVLLTELTAICARARMVRKFRQAKASR